MRQRCIADSNNPESDSERDQTLLDTYVEVPLDFAKNVDEELEETFITINLSELADIKDSREVNNLLQPAKKISMDDFELQSVIGRGLLAKVFLCKHKKTNKYYAMKVLKKEVLIKSNLLVKTMGKCVT